MNYSAVLVLSLCAIVTGAVVGARAVDRHSQTPRSRHNLQSLLATINSDQHIKTIAIGLLGGLTLGTLAFAVTQAPLTLALAAVGPIVSIRVRSQKTQAVIRYAIEDWPEVLEDLRIRVGSLGTSLPQAFFISAQKFDHHLHDAVFEAERLWILGGSFVTSLNTLAATLNDSASQSIFETLVMCHEDGGYDIARRIEDLRDAREADRALWGEIQARLGSVKVARVFVIVVPGVMGAIGFLLGGSTLSIYSGLGLVGVGISLACVMGCWLWSSTLMKPPNSKAVAPVSRTQLPRLRKALSLTIMESGDR